jgi:hypothetical protein
VPERLFSEMLDYGKNKVACQTEHNDMQQANYRVHQIKSESEGGKKKNGSGSTEDFPPFGRFLSELCGERGAGNPVSEKKQSGTGDGDGYCQNDIPY